MSSNQQAPQFSVGVFGLGVMGRGLALALAEKGPTSVVHAGNWELEPEYVDLMEQEAAQQSMSHKISTHRDLGGFFEAMKSPRLVLLMVPAGTIADSTIERFKPYLESGDVLVDGGNEWFQNSIRRYNELLPLGVSYVGMGVSGGADGARRGASLMVGCEKDIYDNISPILGVLAAEINEDESAIAYVGPTGSGNYVKMIHNGIEYALMQIIAESFSCLRKRCGGSNQEISDVISTWCKTEINSYLLEITSKILTFSDNKEKTSAGGEYLLDKISDSCGSKGTGKWTIIEAAERGVPLPTISASLNCRYFSALQADRKAGSGVLEGPKELPMVMRNQIEKDLRMAVWVCFMVSFAQGLSLLTKTSDDLKWGVQLKSCCEVWRQGCIIRCDLLREICDALDRNPRISNILLDGLISAKMNRYINSTRRIATYMLASGIPCDAILSCVSYFDSLRTANLSTNLVQAQRDYFGGHGFYKEGTSTLEHSSWK